MRTDSEEKAKANGRGTISRKRKEKRMVKKMRKLLANPVHEGFLSCGGESSAENDFMNKLSVKEGIKNGEYGAEMQKVEEDLAEIDDIMEGLMDDLVEDEEAEDEMIQEGSSDSKDKPLLLSQVIALE